MVTGSVSILEIIATLLSAIIIGWIIIQQKVFTRGFKGSKSLFFVALAMLFALFDILVHEFEESTPIPFVAIITSFNHLAMLFLSINALLIIHKEKHKGKY
jgi:drug/metabolite transporter (DMT)-like permease